MKASERIETQIRTLIHKEIPKAVKAQQRRILNLLKVADMIPSYFNQESMKQIALDIKKSRLYLETETGTMLEVQKVSLVTPFVQMSQADFRHGLDNLSPDAAGTLKLLKFLEELNSKNITNYFVSKMNY